MNYTTKTGSEFKIIYSHDKSALIEECNSGIRKIVKISDIKNGRVTEFVNRNHDHLRDGLFSRVGNLKMLSPHGEIVNLNGREITSFMRESGVSHLFIVNQLANYPYLDETKDYFGWEIISVEFK